MNHFDQLLRDLAARFIDGKLPRIDGFDTGAELTLRQRTDEGRHNYIPAMLAEEIVREGYEALLVTYDNGDVDVCLYERLPDSFLIESSPHVRLYLQPEREAEFLRARGKARASEEMGIEVPPAHDPQRMTVADWPAPDPAREARVA